MGTDRQLISLRSVRTALKRRRRRVLPDAGAMFRSALTVGLGWGVAAGLSDGGGWLMGLGIALGGGITLLLATSVVAVIFRAMGLLREYTTMVAWLGTLALGLVGWEQSFASVYVAPLLTLTGVLSFFSWRLIDRRGQHMRSALRYFPADVLVAIEKLPEHIGPHLESLLTGALKDYADLADMVRSTQIDGGDELVQHAQGSLLGVLGAAETAWRTQRIANDRLADETLQRAAAEMTRNLEARALSIHEAVAAIIPNVVRCQNTQAPALAEHVGRLRALAELRAELRLDERGL